MKIMIASDIHGSFACCKKLFERFNENKCDMMLLLGDILYHGPRNELPMEYDCKKVASLLNSYKEKIISVRGNCDGEVDQMMLEFPILSDTAVINADGVTLYATHGHKLNPKAPFPVPKGNIVVFGHTHIPTDMMLDGIRYINPGSVSIPKNGSERGYSIFENGIFTWKNLEGIEIKPESK
ncbi:MAG: phosphodiesterase [Ruminococcaceae bacterium]|nr:phosphodiesterase [Oscillospiraceae bacterium]